MTIKKNIKRTKIVLGSIILSFLLLNVVTHTISFFYFAKYKNQFIILQNDIPIGTRIILMVLILLISWFIARFIYVIMLSGEGSIFDAINSSLLIFFYLLLTAFTVLFGQMLTPFIIPFLFLIIFIFTLYVLWKFFGKLFLSVIVIFTIFVILITYFLINSQ